MNFYKATDSDYQGIINLQTKNLIINLTDAEKEDGFLSVEFTKAQFQTMNDTTGIIVCKDKEAICGYLCTSLPEFNKSFSLPTAMIELYPQLTYKKKTMDKYSSAVIGPWCIDHKYRGEGVYIKMWNALNENLPGDIHLLTTFISTKNPRSFNAAKKVGMEEVTKFKFNKHAYWLLAKES